MKIGIAKKNYGIFVRTVQPYPPVNPNEGMAIEKDREYYVPDDYNFKNGWFKEKDKKEKNKDKKNEIYIDLNKEKES